MTVPRERLNALKNTRRFLRDLMDPQKTPKIPKSVRVSAYWCLRHFPGDLELDKVAKVCPEIFERYPEGDDAA